MASQDKTFNNHIKHYCKINGEANERSYVQYSTSSNQQNLMKYSPLYKLESVVAAWYKQAHANDASTDVNTTRKKALQITAPLGADYSRDSNGWINRLKGHNTVYNSLVGERRSVDSKMVMTGNMTNNCQVLKNVTSVTR